MARWSYLERCGFLVTYIIEPGHYYLRMELGIRILPK